MWSQALLLVLTCLSWSYAQEDSDAIAKRLPTLKLYEYEDRDELYLFYNETYAKIITSTYQGRRQTTNAISITDIAGYKNKTYVTYLSSIGYNTYWHQHNLLRGFACYYSYTHFKQGTYLQEECFSGMIKALARANNTWIKENIIPFSPANMFFDLQFIVCIEEILIRGSTAHFDWIHRFYTKDYPTTNFY